MQSCNVLREGRRSGPEFTFPIVLIGMWESEDACAKRNGLIHAKSLQIDLIFSIFCRGCRANPLLQLMADADSARPISCAHFGILHYFKRGKRARASHAFAYFRCGRVANKWASLKGFPTIQEVEKADKEQLARWYRQRFRGILQRNVSGRMPGCPLVYNLDRNPADRRDLAQGIERESASQGSRGEDAQRIRQ
jgi:hypothetical protein